MFDFLKFLVLFILLSKLLVLGLFIRNFRGTFLLSFRLNTDFLDALRRLVEKSFFFCSLNFLIKSLIIIGCCFVSSVLLLNFFLHLADGMRNIQIINLCLLRMRQLRNWYTCCGQMRHHILNISLAHMFISVMLNGDSLINVLLEWLLRLIFRLKQYLLIDHR